LRVHNEQNRFLFCSVCIAIMIVLACQPVCAATSGRSITVTTNPVARGVTLTTVPAPGCPTGCECLSAADAQARWGAGGYTQCSQTPCYQYSTEIGSIKFFCYQQKKVTTAVVGNIPPVTTTLVPVIKNVPAVPTTTLAKIITPDPCSMQGKVNCGGTCVDIKSDPANCGQCGGKCPGKADTCFAGFCQAGCTAGQTECNYGYCVDLLTNSDHCGACGNVCMPNSQCIDGSCVCIDGFDKCDGGKTCIDVRDDPENCGKCGHECSFKGYDTCCGGNCKHIMMDPANCGSCGTICPDGMECDHGHCIEPFDYEKDKQDRDEQKNELFELLNKIIEIKEHILQCASFSGC